MRMLKKRILIQYLKSPLALGASYFGLIPAFAFVYAYVIQDEFYHSNLRVEPSYYEDISRFEDLIRVSLSSYLLDIQADQEYEFRGVGALNYYPEDRRFKLSVHVDRKGSTCPSPPRTLAGHLQNHGCVHEKIYWCQLRHYSTIKNYYSRNGYSMGCDSEKNVPFRETDRDFLSHLNISVESYMLERDYTNQLYSDLTILSFSKPDLQGDMKNSRKKKSIIVNLQGFERYIEGYQTIPSVNVYMRMLYFSIVTITTLGYGDISPVTNRARLLVGIETLLGILLIGLFLNAITRGRGAIATK